MVYSKVDTLKVLNLREKILLRSFDAGLGIKNPDLFGKIFLRIARLPTLTIENFVSTVLYVCADSGFSNGKLIKLSAALTSEICNCTYKTQAAPVRRTQSCEELIGSKTSPSSSESLRLQEKDRQCESNLQSPQTKRKGKPSGKASDKVNVGNSVVQKCNESKRTPTSKAEFGNGPGQRPIPPAVGTSAIIRGSKEQPVLITENARAKEYAQHIFAKDIERLRSEKNRDLSIEKGPEPLGAHKESEKRPLSDTSSVTSFELVTKKKSKKVVQDAKLEEPTVTSSTDVPKTTVPSDDSKEVQAVIRTFWLLQKNGTVHPRIIMDVCRKSGIPEEDIRKFNELANTTQATGTVSKLLKAFSSVGTSNSFR